MRTPLKAMQTGKAIEKVVEPFRLRFSACEAQVAD